MKKKREPGVQNCLQNVKRGPSKLTWKGTNAVPERLGHIFDWPAAWTPFVDFYAKMQTWFGQRWKRDWCSHSSTRNVGWSGLRHITIMVKNGKLWYSLTKRNSIWTALMAVNIIGMIWKRNEKFNSLVKVVVGASWSGPGSHIKAKRNWLFSMANKMPQSTAKHWTPVSCPSGLSIFLYTPVSTGQCPYPPCKGDKKVVIRPRYQHNGVASNISVP